MFSWNLVNCVHIADSPDKKRMREKLTQVLNQIQQSLASNRGEPSPPPFVIPTARDRKFTVKSSNSQPEGTLGRRESFDELPSPRSDNDSAESSPAESPTQTTFDGMSSLPLPGSSINSSGTIPPMMMMMSTDSGMNSATSSKKSTLNRLPTFSDIPPPPPELEYSPQTEEDLPPPPTPPPF